ncbi:MAG: DUF4446 family protein [Capsulimonadales bacterium]|nr:DUF4446 family protein [Capsulimonadales bacterium]
MEQIFSILVDWVRREPAMALATALAAYGFLLVGLIVLAIRLTILTRKQARLLRGAEGGSLERMLLDHADGTREVKERISEAYRTGAENSEAIRRCLQKVGLVRFDAFADVGGEQSFSLALLDEANNGLVISGLYSRNDMRVYAKPVVAGGSPMSLTSEEQKAIGGANTGGPITQQAVRNSVRGSAGGRR